MTGGLVSLLGAPAPVDRSDPQRTQAAAGEFEALLIGSLLKSMREAGSSGWLGTGEQDKASESLMEIAEQQLAQLMAAQGGLGLARLVVQGLSQPAVEAAQQKAPFGR